MPPVISLTTDFGAFDSYVGVMKGVILGINPQAAIIDLTHQIQPQNIRQAAFVLGGSYRYFPPNVIHVAIVDPGVGTERRAVLLLTPQGRFVAPDNGILGYVLKDYLDRLVSPTGAPGRVSVPVGCAAYQLNNPDYWLHPVSNTFHGRDIFSPVAAHLSLGVTPAELGQPVNDLVWLPWPAPSRQGNIILGEVIYIDHFGNLITSVTIRELNQRKVTSITVKNRRIGGLSQTFHDPGATHPEGLVALEGSHGYLEIAIRDGNAARSLDVAVGEPVQVTLR